MIDIILSMFVGVVLLGVIASALRGYMEKGLML